VVPVAVFGAAALSPIILLCHFLILYPNNHERDAKIHDFSISFLLPLEQRGDGTLAAAACRQ
jgi:hypothetical protein